MHLIRSLLLLSLLPYLAAAQNAPATRPTSEPTIEIKGNVPIADGATHVKLADGFAFTEGATANADGDVYFIDQPNDRIMLWKYDRTSGGGDDLTKAKGETSVFLHPSGYSNGMSFDPDGNLISCADERNELWSITPDKKITVLLKDHDGKLLNAPNDVWILPTGPNKGGMYLTDPLYSRLWWGALRPQNDRNSQQPGRYVYYFSPDHKTLTPVIKDFQQPNGIIGTPDGKTLYASDMNGGKTFQYPINPDGSLGEKKLFCETPSDGMTIDDQGNIYTTHGRNGMIVWNKEGQKIGEIKLGCANICFGGKNKDILFINSARAVYGLKMKVHGVGPT